MTLVAEGIEVGIADHRQIRAFRAAGGRIAKIGRLGAGLIAQSTEVSFGRGGFP